MDWKLILRIAIIITLMFLLASSVSGCRNKVGPFVDWDDCSQQVGDHPCDFTLVDQNGDEFNLYDHYGKVIILDFSAMWCGPCMMAAQEIEHLQQKYGDKIVYVTILIENQNYNPPTEKDLKNWADYFKIKSAPVLEGSRDLMSTDPDAGWLVTGWPTFYIIDQNMIITNYTRGFYQGLIEHMILTNLEQDTGSP